MHVLVIGQHGVSLCLEKVDVPNAQNGQQDGNVLVQGSAAEMVILAREATAVSVATATQASISGTAELTQTPGVSDP